MFLSDLVRFLGIALMVPLLLPILNFQYVDDHSYLVDEAYCLFFCLDILLIAFLKQERV